MEPLLIGVDELSELAAGRPGVVSASGINGLQGLPLLVLQPINGVLRRGPHQAEDSGAVLLLPGEHRLAILAPNADTAEGLAAALPADLPQLIGKDPLPLIIGWLAAALSAGEVESCGARLAPLAEPPLTMQTGLTGLDGLHVPPDLALAMMPCGAEFQGIRLHQHTANHEGTYQHLDISLMGLAGAGILWREARFKVFERRSTIGIEIRKMKGWPPLFDKWPIGGSDQFSPFWRLETRETINSLLELKTTVSRTVLAALLEVLPDAAHNAAGLAKLEQEQQRAWRARAKALTSAVAAAVAVAETET